MATHRLLQPAAHEAVRRTVVDIETRTSAELVVSVRLSAGRYREADYLGGAIVALLTLLGLLYLPPVFPLWTFAPNVIIGFAIGAALVSRSAWCRRHLMPASAVAEQTRRAATAMFLDAGYADLPDRRAVLVYVGILEERVEVVTDVGVRDAVRHPDWDAACQGLTVAVRQGDVDGFIAALGRLGARLADAHPAGAENRNELADEVQVS